MITKIKLIMSILKTDLTLFENLSDWKFKENFTTVKSEFGELDIHFVDENSTNDECVLLLHGNPTWGYLYRNMIDPLKDNGYRFVLIYLDLENLINFQ